MVAIRELQAHFPGKIIVANMKTCDAGKHESILVFESGANATTVIGLSPIATIR